ncbi:MAG TPA: metalloregulator ArsR/SmtB family transcription factor [Acidiferrobacterales bacterium]
MHIDPPTLFRLLADETRLRCLTLLAAEGELCVCELTHALGLSQPKVSRHLAVLRENGVVSDRRAGLWVYYRLNPELPDWARGVLRAAVEGNGHAGTLPADRAALDAMPGRPAAPRCCT